MLVPFPWMQNFLLDIMYSVRSIFNRQVSLKINTLKSNLDTLKSNLDTLKPNPDTLKSNRDTL